GAGIVLGAGLLEAQAIRKTLLRCGSAGMIDGTVMEVEPDEARFWKCARHDHRRGTMAAADIGPGDAGFQALYRPVERRKPVLHEMMHVARAEEALGPREQALIMLLPAQGLAGSERLLDLRDRVVHG